MREKGNGEPFVCVQNLVKTMLAEVPFNRSKGIDPRVIDKPLTSIEEIDANVTDLISEFESRVNADNVSITLDTENGDFDIRVDISPKNEI